VEVFQKLKYTGTMVNYYFVCPRKLWLFVHNLSFEHDSEIVEIGKLISQHSYQREDKEIEIDKMIVIDWIDFEQKVIHEVKKSDKMEEAHIWQVKYYLYYLEMKGIKGFIGVIDYPKMHRKQKVELNSEDRKRLEIILEEINKIITLEKPPEKVKISACKSCSYHNFCWV
jgi:CRISPR-associated exonuclease Cas4